jgi:hypothetical protein
MSPTGEEALGGALAVPVAFEDALIVRELEEVDPDTGPDCGDPEDKELGRDGEAGTDAEADGRDVMGDRVVGPMLVMARVDAALDA